MAGLALCVSDLPEMVRIVKRQSLGVLITEVTPQAIAASINRLNPLAIDLYKRNALVAAQEYCWENEGQRLLDACESVVATKCHVL
jgi:glycogen(starch) synthase